MFCLWHCGKYHYRKLCICGIKFNPGRFYQNSRPLLLIVLLILSLTVQKLPVLRWLKCFLVLLQCPHRPWPDRQWGLCIFDDVVEHCSPSSFKYAEYFLRPMLQSICDNSPEVRQAAAYGVGVMAQFGGDSYRPFCTGTYVP